jgi:hypothetical protein
MKAARGDDFIFMLGNVSTDSFPLSSFRHIFELISAYCEEHTVDTVNIRIPRSWTFSNDIAQIAKVAFKSTALTSAEGEHPS